MACSRIRRRFDARLSPRAPRSYRALQQRRALEIEGFHTDVGQLRAAMRRVERQWALVNGVVADAALADQVRAVAFPSL